MTHTPGPWTARKEGGTWYVEVGRDQDYFDICELFGGGIKMEANAYLIAAAPELYKELTNANEWLKRLRANVKDGYASLPVNITALDATMLYVKQALALVEEE